MSLLPLLLSSLFALLPRPSSPAQPAPESAYPIRANYLITVADDFVVEVYHNGKAVPESKRTLLLERFGATVERMNIEVHKGDWLVFNVVNDRLRWGGASYFAVAGCLEQNSFGFVSSLDTGDWSACDTPSDVDRFISEKTYYRHHPAQKIGQPWAEGMNYMRGYAGAGWEGTPLWGTTKNTWIKVIVQ